MKLPIKAASYPAPNSLTGTQGVTAADAFSGTGIVRVAVTNSDGTVQDFADIDLSTMVTVQDVIDEINLIPGASASINVDGVLEITAGSGSQGIAINEMTSSVGAGSQGFSSYFGLNDIFTGTDASSIAIHADLASDAARFPSGRLSDDGALASGDLGLTSGDVENAEALVDLFEADQSFAAAGGLGAKSVSFADYGQTIQAQLSNDVSAADNQAQLDSATYDDFAQTISAQTGVNLDEEIANMNTYQQSYEAGAYVLSTVQEMFDVLMNSVS